jgi:NAD(P)H-hydrate epimerase
VDDGDAAEVRTQILTGLTHHDLIVDCLLGTGIKGAVRDPFNGVIRAVNATSARVLAVDVPSGMDADTGQAQGECIRAEQTVTFVAAKQGFASAGASEFTGVIDVAHIGIPQDWITERVDRFRAATR